MSLVISLVLSPRLMTNNLPAIFSLLQWTNAVRIAMHSKTDENGQNEWHERCTAAFLSARDAMRVVRGSANQRADVRAAAGAANLCNYLAMSELITPRSTHHRR